MKCKIFLISIISSIFLVTACGGPKFEARYDWELPDFMYVNQDGEEVSKEDLLGEAWLANFVFSHCSTVCSPMTANMAKIQRQMKEEGLDNKLVSFTVDPERDTSPVFKAYAAKFEADHSQWHFLTGYSQEEIGAMAKAFKTMIQKEEGTDQFVHSTLIFLIDGDGTIVKSYNGLNVPFEEILSDLKALQ